MIVVFGTACLDSIRHIPHLPAPGAYVEVESEATLLGGEAANTAAHLRRWGAKATLLGNAACANADGILLAELLNQKDLYYNLHEVSVNETPRCDIYVTADGERTMFGIGFNRMVVPDVETFVPEAGAWFTTDANLGQIAESYAERASRGGMAVYLMDLPPDSKVLGPGVYWQSSTRWYGERGNTTVNMALVSKIADSTGATAILTDSGNGFVVASPEIAVRSYPAFPRNASKDSTGAGDIFRAGMLFGLDQSSILPGLPVVPTAVPELVGLDQAWPLSKCLAFAAGAATLAAAYVGAAEGPTKQEVETLLKANPQLLKEYE